jgi:hypothetical protein
MTAGSERAAHHINICEELLLLEFPEQVKGVGLAHMDKRTAVMMSYHSFYRQSSIMKTY